MEYIDVQILFHLFLRHSQNFFKPMKITLITLSVWCQFLKITIRPAPIKHNHSDIGLVHVA